VVNKEEQDDLKVKKAWEVALGPAKTYSSTDFHLSDLILK
jgi:hypothetical protein